MNRRNTKMSVGLALLVVAPFLVLFGCGGGSSSSLRAPINVSITPGSPSVSVGASQQFSAMVTGTSNTTVNWSVAEANGGTIDSAGKYTAPMKAGSFHVIATSQADSSKSASAGVSVTAPAPVFSTNPPTASAQDTLYSYAVSATDPAGTAVTLTLTTAPHGATLTGKAVSWTPTVNQSRIPNAFTVTATSEAGGTATQSWSLSPDGTVFGHFLLHFWGDGADHVLPERDFSVPPIERDPGTLLVWASQPDGSLKIIQGVGFADGSFQFPNVPAGSYIFSLNGHPDVVQGIQETTSTIFWDQDENGFPPLDISQAWPEALTINVNGMDPFVAASDEFDLYDRDGGWSFTSFLNDGDTSFIFAISSLLENAPSITDRFVAVQTRGVPNTDPFTSHIEGPSLIQPFSAINNVPEIEAGTIVDFSGELGITTPGMLDLNIGFSTFANSFMTAAPGPSTPNHFEVVATSMVRTPKSSLSDPQINQVTPILADAFIQAPVFPGDPDPWPKDANGNDTWPADQDFGLLNYDDPFSASEKKVYIVDAQANFSIPIPGSATPLPWTLDTSYAVTSLPNGPISAVLMPPPTAKADAIDFLTGGTVSSPTPTLTWGLPTGGPNGPTDVITYDVFICEPQVSSGGKGGGGGVACVFDLLVNNITSNSFMVPAGVLQPGHSYIFNITAGSMRDYDPNNQQRFSFPIAFSQVTSAAITVGGGGKAVVAQSSARKATVHRLAVNSPPHRDILSTLLGHKHGSALSGTPSWSKRVIVKQP
ncbi:MAG TPA: Ig-like domain-containing protein [Candidatus Sulfotelmatobacter sp.]|nr:Ig-like domain-containing protein [Candidatus Sulfotelmatobacter sp.]